MLQLRILVQPVDSQLPSDARLLVAAVRCGAAENVMVIDPDGPRLDSAGEVLSSLEIAGPDGSGQAVGRAVC